jgi:hypothetical protein
MKDQVTTLMEALRLVSAAVEQFKRKRQNRDATLAAIESVINDPKVVRAEQALHPLLDAPSVVPDGPGHATIRCPECQNPMALTHVLPAIDSPSPVGTFFCKACQFATTVKLDE